MRSRLAAFAAMLTLSLSGAVLANSLDNPNVPTGEGDSIFVVDENGSLEPVAIRRKGAFLKAEPTDGTLGQFNSEANATLNNGGGKVHVIFGRRVVATVAVTVADAAAKIKLPPSLHLGGYVNALASPTLAGSANGARRAPTSSERASALALAAAKLGTPVRRLTVGNLTAIDLGAGTAVVGDVNAKGSGAPRKDKRLFFIAENVGGTLTLSLSNQQTITVSEPLLEEVGEQLIDAVDLGAGMPAVVTREVGYDAHTFVIYTRRNHRWKAIYAGGGVAV